MIRAIVVDDEWYNLEEISDLIMETGLFKKPIKYQSPVSALREAEIIRPEVAFVDIEMPVIDGIQLAQLLQEINPKMVIVFVTAWNKYAVEAFDVNALDYILKPINPNRFNKMIDKVKNEVYNLRQQSGNELQITCFGKLEVWIDKIPVKWERAKAEELFAFLLMNHKQFISKETIIDNLWPEYEQQKALQILQTAVCKIRNIFSSLDSKVVVQYNQSKYCLIIKETNCDLFWMEKLIDCLKYHNEDVVISDLDHAIELCKKGFLTQNGYLWSFEMDERFKQELVSILNTVLNKGQELSCEYRIELLRYLAELLPYEDAVNYQLLQDFKKCGRESDARKHFQWLTKILMEQYDTKPSKRIRDLFGN